MDVGEKIQMFFGSCTTNGLPSAIDRALTYERQLLHIFSDTANTSESNELRFSVRCKVSPWDALVWPPIRLNEKPISSAFPHHSLAP